MMCQIYQQQKIKYDNLSNKMADFNKHIDKTLENLLRSMLIILLMVTELII